MVAIKKFKECEDDEIIKKTSLREVKILRMLRHENIVQLKEAFRRYGDPRQTHIFPRKGKLYLVFEFVDKNLLEVVSELYPSGFSPGLVRSTVWQIVRAIEYCHRHDIIHRDIKPENLLVNLSDMAIKLCDFGFARTLPVGKKHNLTDYVATRWYRAPELLVGCHMYGPEVDMFAIGCIMGEISDGEPLLPGESELDQLSIIHKVIGRLNGDQLVAFSANPRFRGSCIPARPLRGTEFHSLEHRYANKLTKKGLSIMKSLLEIDPAVRLTADAAIRNQYFDGIGSVMNRRPSRSPTTKAYRTTGLPPPMLESRHSSTESLLVQRGRGYFSKPLSQPSDFDTSFSPQTINLLNAKQRRSLAR